MSFGHDFNPFVVPFAAKREIRVRETELIHTLIPDGGNLAVVPRRVFGVRRQCQFCIPSRVVL